MCREAVTPDELATIEATLNNLHQQLRATNPLSQQLVAARNWCQQTQIALQVAQTNFEKARNAFLTAFHELHLAHSDVENLEAQALSTVKTPETIKK